MKNSMTKQEYMLKVAEKYGDKYKIDLSNFKGITKGYILLECKLHGISKYTPRSILISTYGCRSCSAENRVKNKTKSYEDFMEDAIKIHDGKYLYPDINRITFKNRESKIEIICSKHGTFYKTGTKHLCGQGCHQCNIDFLIENGKLQGGYNLTYFNSYPESKNLEAIVYYLKVGKRYKIGITTNFYNRVKSIKSESKQEVNIIEIYNTTLFNAYNIEQKILEIYKDFRIYRRWSTELFSEDVLHNLSIINFT